MVSKICVCFFAKKNERRCSVDCIVYRHVDDIKCQLLSAKHVRVVQVCDTLSSAIGEPTRELR